MRAGQAKTVGVRGLREKRRAGANLRTVGDAVWDRFTALREESLCFYRALVDAFRANPAHRIAFIDELDRTVTETERLA